MKHSTVKNRSAIARTFATTVILICLICPRAEAHLVTTGLGPVYDGIAHMAFSATDIVLVVVLTLLSAMRGLRSGRRVLALLPVVWLLGGLIGLMFPINLNFDWTIGFSFILVGVLVAADRNLTLNFISIVVAIIGSFHGFSTGVALAETSSAGLELIGELVALIIVVTVVAGLVVSLKAFWMRIVVRVLGSWIAATGILIIGWTLRAGI